MRKNVANQTVAAQMVSATDGSAVTSGTTTVVVTIDGGTQASVGNATHEGNGTWTMDTGNAANTNGNHAAFTFYNSSAVAQCVQTWPVAHANDQPTVNVGSWLGTTVPTPATAGRPSVDVLSIGNTTQTARDVSADTAAIVADTNELQGDWANGGRLDLILDARASQSTADAIEADTQDLQTQVGTAGAGLTDLGGMSTTMKGQVNTEADTALTDYDPPTNTEMEARTLAAASYFDPAADTVATVTTVTNAGNATLGNNAHQATSFTITGNLTAGNIAATHVGDTTGNTTGSMSGSVGSVTARVTANADQIAGNTTAASNLSASALGVVSSTVNDASATTTSFVTALTEATDDHYNSRVVVFTSGALAGQATDITDYIGSSKTLTVTALTEAPANSVSFVIV